ncbi:MAG: type IV pilus biogenesis/stability protein PilW [Immundisolibacteraceae bacterium]|nr:type IV pilus biogenesis/stability protein PilW [Immundisolibacteraceae bacterium]
MKLPTALIKNLNLKPALKADRRCSDQIHANHYSRRLIAALLLTVGIGLLTGCAGTSTRLGASTGVGNAESFGNKQVPAACREPNTAPLASLADKQSSSQLHLRLGIGYMQKGALETALSELNKSIKIAPGYAEAHSALALLNTRLKRFDEARKNYKRALRISPGDPNINNNFGFFLCQQGEYLAADKKFQCAIANPLYSTPWRAYYNGGICALKADQLKQADIYLRTTIQLRPDLITVLFSLAELAYQQGSYQRSLDYLDRYKISGRPSPQSLMLGIKLANKLEDSDLYASQAMALKNLFPDSEQAQSLYNQ